MPHDNIKKNSDNETSKWIGGKCKFFAMCLGVIKSGWVITKC